VPGAKELPKLSMAAVSSDGVCPRAADIDEIIEPSSLACSDSSADDACKMWLAERLKDAYTVRTVECETHLENGGST
jgi:hypothetical protein